MLVVVALDAIDERAQEMIEMSVIDLEHSRRMHSFTYRMYEGG